VQYPTPRNLAAGDHIRFLLIELMAEEHGLDTTFRAAVELACLGHPVGLGVLSAIKPYVPLLNRGLYRHLRPLLAQPGDPYSEILSANLNQIATSPDTPREIRRHARRARALVRRLARPTAPAARTQGRR
jgi:hypothetical protein